MPSMTPCPACGLPSPASEIRCPRCYAVKIKGGCTGACTACARRCSMPKPLARLQKSEE